MRGYNQQPETFAGRDVYPYIIAVVVHHDVPGEPREYEVSLPDGKGPAVVLSSMDAAERFCLRHAEIMRLNKRTGS